MKKLLFALLTLGLLFGCSNGEPVKDSAEKKVEKAEQGEKTEVVTVIISKNNGEETIEKKEIEIKDGEKVTVMDIMQENFELETQFDGAFISSINGVAASEAEQTAWFYSVNGEEAMVGANEFELKPEDKVQFDLHKWE
ncbi:DUF4430 domain-containing protein [Fredinandcohnia humi]